MKKLSLLIFLLYNSYNACYSQPGNLDPSFANGGVARTDLGSKFNYNFDNSSEGKQVLLLPEGGIYVVLTAPIYNGTLITKRLSDGKVDNKYGKDGFSASVPINDPDAALQADGKIVVVGWTYKNFVASVSLARFNKDGSLDNSFKTNKTQILEFGTDLSIAIQSDGKIVVAGSEQNNEDTYFAVERYNADGSVDKSFGTNGKQIVDFGLKLPDDPGGPYQELDFSTSVAIQNGKIVIAGFAYNYTTFTNDFAVARLNNNGSADNTFDKDGKQTNDFSLSDDYANGIAIQDDKIVLAGYSNTDMAIIRYNTNGSLDKTFSNDGKQTSNFGSANDVANAVAIKSNGKIVVTGTVGSDGRTDFAIAVYNKDGSLDKSFSQDGKQITDFGSADNIANSVAIAIDGKVVVGGYTSSGSHTDFRLARYTLNGSLDNSFDGKGALNEIPVQGYTDYNNTAVQKDGKIITVGNTWNGKNFDFVVARYNTDGSLDKSFSDDGFTKTDFKASDDEATAVAIQTDGKIVVAGRSNSNFAIARYNKDGSLDKLFNKSGKQTTDFASSNDAATSLAIQSNGKIVVAGISNADFAVVQYTTSGELDKTFSLDGKQLIDFGSSDDCAYSLAIQRNGKIVVAGRSLKSFDGYSESYVALARLNTNGKLDNSFDGDGKQINSCGSSDNAAHAVAIQSDDKIVVAGYTGSSPLFAVLRYDKNGRIDKSFSDDGLQTTDLGVDYNIAKCLGIEKNGKIVLAGYAFKDGRVTFALARYTIDGTLDKTFSNDGIQITEASEGDNFINGIAIAEDKLYAAGTGRYPGDLGVLARYVLAENKAPIVRLSTAGNVLTYTAPATIKLTAAASDEDGSISKVQFYSGGILLHTESLQPYNFSAKNVPAGTYIVYAKAIDNAGNITVSNSVKLTVKSAVGPIVKIVSPLQNATYAGLSTVNLVTSTKAQNGKISSVKFFSGLTLLKSVTTYPYNYSWKNVLPGTYILTAVATDDKGEMTVSEQVTITVTKPTIVRKPMFENLETGISDNLTLKLSPNPARNILQVSTSGLVANKPMSVTVISATGSILKNTVANTAAKVLQIDVSSFANGLYTVRVMSENKVLVKQFMKL